MAKRTKTRIKPQNRVDSSFEKPKNEAARRKFVLRVYGRARNYRGTFELIWDKLRGALLKSASETEVIQAFETEAASYAHEFVPALAGLGFKVVHHPKFPKRREPQIKYLADSLTSGLRQSVRGKLWRKSWQKKKPS